MMIRSTFFLLLFIWILSPGIAQEKESLSPVRSLPLADELWESSGLVWWDGSLWSHNDSEDTGLYRLDPESGEITEIIRLNNVVNTDWEDMAQDEAHIYIGDFGNNTGNRRDLHILKISKSSILKGRPEIRRISFSYEDQEDFSSRPNAHDFDCEAMIVRKGEILLFTKEWISAGTTVYSLPAKPGEHVAKKLRRYNINGLITGADLPGNGSGPILCGYNSIMQPFLLVFDQLPGKYFERIPIALPSHQVEAIAIRYDMELYISNEYLRLRNWIEIDQKIHQINLLDWQLMKEE